MNKRKQETKSVGEEAAERLFLRKDRQKEAASIIDRIVAERGLGSASVGERWLNPDGSLLPSEPAGAPPMKCSCVIDFKQRGRWISRRCRGEAKREVRVHQENEHPQVGTGWFWVPLCEKHFFGSKFDLRNLRLRYDWRWL